MLSLKDGVVFEEISDEIVEILPILSRTYRSFGKTCVITSARDGKHMSGSKHYTGEALDTRIYYLPVADRLPLLRALQAALGPDFDVILEKDHIHLEYDPA